MERQQYADEGGATPGDRPSFIELQEAVTRSPGYRITALLGRIDRISYILQRNVADYLGLVARVQDPDDALALFDTRNPGPHDELLSEVERLLHNVLTGISTRVDQLRVVATERFDDTELKQAYDDEVKSVFATDTASAFLKKLRNYMAHYELPVGQSQQTFTRHSFSVTFTLRTAPLLRWKDWNATERRWMTGLGDDIMIVDLVQAYAKKAADFDNWLMREIAAKYREEIADLRRAEARYNQMHDRIFDF
ncbi:hypothetical protein Caci_8571 [Catenulispora acidiphila DSM 44928]|uniref:Uncharacterized protein n=1 Tax=Catenulispora acidiphila (strain DSM 44928 / JCM 14897 / NBRC 102108 / NRRL B-24433 / ID139908) TaxID=479433 RepID=C7PYR8_CATAD|nr:hypothetical protein [Catenulispora acidiphila]ACU77390.1 hypothetical protein Caci_8571 [Catenulispora acidiphila DSM 44928]